MHDGVVHHPLGSGSYAFQTALIESVIRSLGLPTDMKVESARPPTSVIIHIGAQPNNSPHVGTIVVFIFAFLVARGIKEHFQKIRFSEQLPIELQTWIDDLQISVHLDFVDTAPDKDASKDIDGVVYQRSLRQTQAKKLFLPHYDEIMESAQQFTGGQIPFEITDQKLLTSMPFIPCIIEAIVNDHERLAPELAPGRGTLAMRSACPHEGCGLADKHGVHNEYSTLPGQKVEISFLCPLHGRHTVNTSNAEDVARLEFNTPLRSLVRTFAYGMETQDSQRAARATLGSSDQAREKVHMRVTGADYAGQYSEQLLWRQLQLLPSLTNVEAIPPPLFLYAPLILDWAGSKLSKSLYVKPGAYEYLREAGMSYLLSYEKMKECGQDLKVLFHEVERWIKEPKKLFRSYSVEYLHRVFEEEKNMTI